MADVFDVAKYILNKMGKISTWKLQKLCYYSQAWHIAWTEHPIFDEDFEAWSNGPVCPELFKQHQGLFMVSEENFSFGDISNLTDDQKESIDIILRDYGNMSPYELRELTHREQPWKETRGDLPDFVRSNKVISKDLMGDFYSSL